MPTGTRLLSVLIIAVLILSSTATIFAQDDTNHTVVTGDSLDKIGALYDVQVNCLAESNDLTRGSMLKPGQTLFISFDCPNYDGFDFVVNARENVNADVVAQAQDGTLGQGGGGGALGTTYIIERGDTLDTIGQRLNISVVSLQLANELSGGAIIQPGQELIIPPDAVPYGEFPAVAAGGEGQGGGSISGGYVVQIGDTLDGIGARFDVQVACLVETNNLANPEWIYPGNTLTISTDCPRYDGFDFVTNPRGE